MQHRTSTRKTCSEAGFVRKAEEMKSDPIFLAFKKSTIFIPEKGDVEIPVGGLVIFSGSKSHAGKDCYVLLCAVC